VDDDRLSRLAHDAERLIPPAWRRRTEGEPRWPSAIAVVVLIGLQLALPERLSLASRWLLPGIEVVLIGVLIAANPGRMGRGASWLRRVSLGLITVASIGNGWSIWRLVEGIVTGHDVGSAAELLASGGAVWLINVLTFAVWYWEFDRGGPLNRALGVREQPDLLFPQMTEPELDRDWEPEFLDYLYVAFTNSTAFSPTDTLPLSRWVKLVMLLQSLFSLTIAALVVAKAVNALQ
jgi:uncharacterized membrane protein